MNVTNEGKTAIKRMRARLRFYPLPKPSRETSMDKRPDGISEEDWQHTLRLREEFENRMQREIAESQFGRPLPFSSRTPKGTMGRPWVEADDRISYEVDLSPKSDEASVELVALFPLDEIALNDLEKAGVLKINRPPGTPFPPAKVIVILIGNNSGLVINPRGEGLLYDLALKFWIVSENMTEDVTQIFHVEIPNSLDNIVCTKLRKSSKQYKQFERMLST